MKPDALCKKNRKHKLWKRYCRTRTIYDRCRYNIVKNELHALTRKLRADFETNSTQH